MQCRTGHFASRLSNCPGNNNNLNDERAVLSPITAPEVVNFAFSPNFIMYVGGGVGVVERGRRESGWNNRVISVKANGPIVIYVRYRTLKS